MLTGDTKAVGEKVAGKLGLDLVYTELLPADKVAHMEELLARTSEKGRLAFVGDGINDAPVLARADIGIAMAIVRQNIVFALGVKAFVLLLGALGIASMWAAVFADVGVAVIAILNAVRALRVPKEEKVLRKENFREAPAG